MEEEADPWNIFFWILAGVVLMVSSIMFILLYSPRGLFFMVMIPVVILDLGISIFFIRGSMEELREFWISGDSVIARAYALQDRLLDLRVPMDQDNKSFLGRVILFLFFTILVAFIHNFNVLLDILIFILMVLGIGFFLFVLDPL